MKDSIFQKRYGIHVNAYVWYVHVHTCIAASNYLIYLHTPKHMSNSLYMYMYPVLGVGESCCVVFACMVAIFQTIKGKTCCNLSKASNFCDVCVHVVSYILYTTRYFFILLLVA